jgi:hypothetical protein
VTWTRAVVSGKYISWFAGLHSADIDCPSRLEWGRGRKRVRWVFQPDTERQRAEAESTISAIMHPRAMSLVAAVQAGALRVRYETGPKDRTIGYASEDVAEFSRPEPSTPDRAITARQEAVGEHGHVLPDLETRDWKIRHYTENATEGAEMKRGPSFQQTVVKAESRPANDGLINLWTYTLEDGHVVTRYLIKSAKPHTRAACDVCKQAAQKGGQS